MADSQLLAPWEYKGEVPQVVEAGELLWNRRPVRFEFLHVELRYYVESKTDVVFGRLVISQLEDNGSWLVNTFDGGKDQSPEMIKSYFAEAAKRNRIWREFYIDSEEVRIQPNGTGYWYQRDHTMSDFHLGRSVANLTSSQTHQMLVDLMANPSSDVACALRFKRMDFEEKRCRTFGFASVEQHLRAEEELRSLCRLVVYSDQTIWKERSRLRCSLMATSDRDLAHFWSAKWDCASPRLAFWARTLEQFGPLRPRLKRLCVQVFQIQPLFSPCRTDGSQLP